MSDDNQAPEVETQAKEIGWSPKEEFKGDPEKWVDASTFLERGQHVLPIVKATNKRLRDDLTQANTQLSNLQQAFVQSQETIKALEEYHAEDVKQKVEKARKDLRTQLVEARREGNVDDQVRIEGELDSLKDAETGSKGNERKDPPTPPQDFTKHPVYVQWRQENPWYDDPAKAAIAQSVSYRLRAEGNRDVGRAFLDKITDETNKELARLGVGSGKAEPKVEGSRGGSGNSTTNGKSYADLPKEAKDACAGFENRLVGKGKKFSTQAEWRKSYATQYFKDV